MSRQSVTDDLVRSQAKRLKMPGLARSLEALARQAREDGWTHEEFLYEVLATELVGGHVLPARRRHAAPA